MIMNKIIFLDIDGVLNSNNSFIDNYEYDKLLGIVYDGSIDDIVRCKMNDIDLDKVFMVRDICNLTGAKIVISSSWIKFSRYPLIEEKLVSLGIHIFDITPYINGNRGDEIRSYLMDNKIDDFIILDDDIFRDFNELENYLIKTNFYEDGLTNDISREIVRILKRN